mmetsp:Transcript_26072/g.77187  ORF Transcript_26072/g.77187 Transcript_26072/m.77187 type:complete len:277 (-) Transcript_26072:249-1079(-)
MHPTIATAVASLFGAFLLPYPRTARGFHIPPHTAKIGGGGRIGTGLHTVAHEDELSASSGLGRRAFLDSLVTAGASTLSFGASPLPANAAIAGGASQSARVSVYPGIENLEPLYELKLSVDALAAGVENPAQWPAVQKRLDKFFKGAILSEKNFYLGVAFQYMNDIKYDDDQAYVVMDKQTRFAAMETCMNALERLKSDLGGNDAGLVEDDAKAAREALASWFALVPEADVRAVEKLFVDVKKADVDRNGVLSDQELMTLPVDEQEVWKQRVAKFG